MTAPLYTFGGGGTLVHLAPANGFPLPVYRPMLNPLLAKFKAISLPPRALWTPPTPPPVLDQVQALDWHSLTDDLLAAIQHYNLPPLIAVGHSFGGIASLLAVLAQPERFKALVLLDPTILPPPAMIAIRDLQVSGQTDLMPLVQGAMRRRARFDSAQAAYDNFRSKRSFADWSDEMLRIYAEEGTRPSADGDGVELVWSPQWEAFYYRIVYTATWEQLPRLAGLLPVLVVRGATSDTFSSESEAQMQAVVPDVTYAVMPGHGHLFPQSAPQETAEILSRWFEEITL